MKSDLIFPGVLVMMSYTAASINIIYNYPSIVANLLMATMCGGMFGYLLADFVYRAIEQ